MGVLDEYRKQLEEDKKLEEAEPKDGADKTEYQKMVDKRVEEIKKNDPNDPDNFMKKYFEQYPDTKEADIPTTDDDLKVIVKRAYCPECGKEIVSKAPLMINPYTGQRLAKYECSCGWKANLEHAYPNVRYVDKDGKEVKCFAE